MEKFKRNGYANTWKFTEYWAMVKRGEGSSEVAHVLEKDGKRCDANSDSHKRNKKINF